MLTQNLFFVNLITMWKILGPHKLIYTVALQSSKVCLGPFMAYRMQSLLIKFRCCMIARQQQTMRLIAMLKISLIFWKYEPHAYKCCAYEKRSLIKQRITGCTLLYSELNLGSITQCLVGLVPPACRYKFGFLPGFLLHEAYVILVPTNFNAN